MQDIRSQILKCKQASVKLSAADTETKNRALGAMADALDKNRERILKANAEDVIEAEKLCREGKLAGPMVKRLMVSDSKIDGMIDGILDVKSLEDPVGETISALELDEGLTLYQVRCPIGVLGVIFESRPDVVPQIMSLCLKSGNAVAFKGGSEAARSNRILFDILRDAAASEGIPKDAFVLMETREDISEILSLDEYIDLLIPRGSNSFVQYIQNNTKIPVLGHASGVCTTYIDSDADQDMALRVVLDAKIQYPAVCNATENVLVHRDIADEFVPKLCRIFAENGVEVRADKSVSEIPGTEGTVTASEEDWSTEYGDYTVAVKVVDSIEEATDFINEYGSHHTDAIITNNSASMKYFVKMVDSADVFVNASTRFADGYRFGKGAEVGISTNKIHARGPVGMEGLMIYKYVLMGNGQEVRGYADGTKKFTHKEKKEDCPL